MLITNFLYLYRLVFLIILFMLCFPSHFSIFRKCDEVNEGGLSGGDQAHRRDRQQSQHPGHPGMLHDRGAPLPHHRTHGVRRPPSTSSGNAERLVRFLVIPCTFAPATIRCLSHIRHFRRGHRHFNP